MKFGIVLWGDISLDRSQVPFPVYTYDEILSTGKSFMQSTFSALPSVESDSIATIVYTSGTSGLPKGVALTHANILYQIDCFKDILQLRPTDQILSLLPPWHIYERAIAYYVFQSGCRVVYTGVKTLKIDLKAYPTEAFVTVPLVLDTLHKTVRQKGTSRNTKLSNCRSCAD